MFQNIRYLVRLRVRVRVRGTCAATGRSGVGMRRHGRALVRAAVAYRLQWIRVLAYC